MRRLIYLVVLLVVLFAGGGYLRSYYLTGEKSVSGKVREDSVLSQYLAATVAERSGDYDLATEYFESALSKDPKNYKIISRLYALYLFNGSYDKAIVQAKNHYEIVKESGKKLDKKELASDSIANLLVALDAFKNGNTKEVPEILKPYTDSKYQPKTHLDGVVIPMVAAWSYAVEEDYKNSFRVIDGITSQYMLSVFSYNRALINDLANHKEVKIDGKNYSLHDKGQKFLAEVFFEIGKFSKQNNNLEEAVIYSRLATYLDDSSNKYRKFLASSYEAMGKLKQAIEIYNQIPESSEFYPEALTGIALAQHSIGDDQKSIETLKKLGELEGFEFQSLFGVGTIKMTMEQYHEAIKYFEEAKKDITKPTKDQWGLYFNLGVAYDKIGDWEKSAPNLKKAVELFPENPESLNYLAYSWLTRNENIPTARKMLEAAVIRSGGAPHILDSYGWALFKLGSYKEALPFLEQASVAMSHSTVINDHLGDLYWKLGRKNEARFQWRKALESFDGDEDITPEINKEDLEKKIESGI